MDYEELIERLYMRTEVCFRRAEIYFGRQLRRARLLYTLSNPTLGQFNGVVNVIRYNSALALATDPEYFIDNIPAHEVAHAIVYELYLVGGAIHGVEWSRIMVEVFGVEPLITYPKLSIENVQPVALQP